MESANYKPIPPGNERKTSVVPAGTSSELHVRPSAEALGYYRHATPRALSVAKPSEMLETSSHEECGWRLTNQIYCTSTMIRTYACSWPVRSRCLGIAS